MIAGKYNAFLSRAFPNFDKLVCFRLVPDCLFLGVTPACAAIERAEQYLREVADECRRTKCSKVLIVENLKKNGSTTDAFEVASEMPKMGFFGIQIAFVDQYVEQRAVNDFGALVATNRGIYVKLFNTVEEAEKWLLL